MDRDGHRSGEGPWPDGSLTLSLPHPAQFYADLTNEAYKTNFAIYHRRFSTNTVPKWPLAQPMRMLGHNGEINTVIGNVNWQKALDIERKRRSPLCSLEFSDSANLDAVFERMVSTGHTCAHALSVLVPEAFKDQPEYAATPEITDMFEYYRGLQEPWDGPALVVFSDGRTLGAGLDRNGLRPARFLTTKDGLVAMMSETGVVDVPDEDVVSKGRLGPGHTIVVDLVNGKFSTNSEVKADLASKAPYGQWLAEHATIVDKRPFTSADTELPANMVTEVRPLIRLFIRLFIRLLI